MEKRDKIIQIIQELTEKIFLDIQDKNLTSEEKIMSLTCIASSILMTLAVTGFQTKDERVNFILGFTDQVVEGINESHDKVNQMLTMLNVLKNI